ncbi:unnamed protein product [Aspergillus oryzae RIB40]|uniref:DNA, SC111 n=1 Tax=Aspergillus oryzae (strain ATCC 42149 / RIB 40) TaxID=510516 RepID=Q2U8R5_ASPOR|nr:unnamed protein product [Aspergillus oryzae RIB40]BAE62050.1 unnamed protein product [Aspergillus oryzae RIB40]
MDLKLNAPSPLSLLPGTSSSSALASPASPVPSPSPKNSLPSSPTFRSPSSNAMTSSPPPAAPSTSPPSPSATSTASASSTSSTKWAPKAAQTSKPSSSSPATKKGTDSVDTRAAGGQRTSTSYSGRSSSAAKKTKTKPPCTSKTAPPQPVTWSWAATACTRRPAPTGYLRSIRPSIPASPSCRPSSTPRVSTTVIENTTRSSWRLSCSSMRPICPPVRSKTDRTGSHNIGSRMPCTRRCRLASGSPESGRMHVGIRIGLCCSVMLHTLCPRATNPPPTPSTTQSSSPASSPNTVTNPSPSPSKPTKTSVATPSTQPSRPPVACGRRTGTWDSSRAGSKN